MNDSGLYLIVRKILDAKSKKKADDYINEYVGNDYLKISRELADRVSYHRTKDQNRLYWEWVGQVASFQGETKEDIHREAKLSIGCPILFRDGEKFAAFYRRVVAPLPRELRLEAMDYIDVSSVMTTKQFSEFADQFEKTWRARGVDLTIPEAA